MADYRYEKTRENGDATSNYNLIGEFPVPFKEFFKWVLETEDSFRIEFKASNKCYGGWFGNKLEVYKDNKTGKCYWEKQKPENWFDEIADINITSVWVNGGWGQISYICTFDVEEQESYNNGE